MGKKKSGYLVILDKIVEITKDEAIGNSLHIKADEAEIWSDENCMCPYVIFKQEGKEVFRVQECSIVAYGPAGNAKVI